MNRTVVLPEDRERHYLELAGQVGHRYAGFDLATSEAVLNLLLTYDLLHQCTARYMAEYGLSKSTFNVLMLLRHGPAQGMQFHDLGDLLLVSRANITGLMSHLEELGFVTRVVDEADRRARYARVTSKAEALLDQFVPLHYSNIGSLMSQLSVDEKSQLVSLLGKVRASIKDNSMVCSRTVEANQ